MTTVIASLMKIYKIQLNYMVSKGFCEASQSTKGKENASRSTRSEVTPRNHEKYNVIDEQVDKYVYYALTSTEVPISKAPKGGKYKGLNVR